MSSPLLPRIVSDALRNRAPTVADARLLADRRELDAYVELSSSIISSLRRAADGCRICARLPDATTTLVDYGPIDTVCRPCIAELERYEDKRREEIERARGATGVRAIERQERARRIRPCAVYVMRSPATGLVKIGRSVNPEKRRQDLIRFHNLDLDVVFTTWLRNDVAAARLERECHRLHTRDRYVGTRELGVEYYEIEAEVVIATIRSLVRQEGDTPPRKATDQPSKPRGNPHERSGHSTA